MATKPTRREAKVLARVRRKLRARRIFAKTNKIEQHLQEKNRPILDAVLAELQVNTTGTTENFVGKLKKYAAQKK